ncbi:MAG: alanine--tRNA ligase [Endozoicomonadaceae bacterium]|nr:alanine--tRNA ligase [Endozoicomonadaceae bacterium]
MKSTTIRNLFITFFKDRAHQEIPGSTLIPKQDPSLLFTNAGMNQFKKILLGVETSPYPCVVTAQRCLRAGGKHNDLDNVGYTARHHTFFEMLGNFSFGQYFKKEAIEYAWEFLTNVLKIPTSKLWVTIYHQDTEAEKIWLNDLQIDPARFSKLGEDDNFWSMGETGPCGPCSEIFYDHGVDVPGDPPGGENADQDRYIEIWNMVFMQYNRTDQGELVLLKHPAIDTGMGLERITAVMQNMTNNYDTDCFQPIIQKAGQLLNESNHQNASLRVIADHIRAASFLVADGIQPTNEGRGYILRRLIRRACRHGYQLGQTNPFFYQLLDTLIETLGSVAEPIIKNKRHISTVLQQEEKQFQLTLDRGMKRLEADLYKLTGQIISGYTIFTLYDTYGFPVDLIQDIARERGLSLNIAEYQRLMTEQREKARSAHQFTVNYNQAIITEPSTHFIGYTKNHSKSTVLNLSVHNKPIDQVDTTITEPILLIVDKTPFYAESGGQIGDIGLGHTETMQFTVLDTQKTDQHIIHIIQIQYGVLTIGDSITLSINQQHRHQIAVNHSSTHLLHATLRKVLGDHVVQKGSLVTSTELRFDFSHPKAILPQEWIEIERLVNEQIQSNTPVITQEIPFDQAIKQGAIALFDEKYTSHVRVLSMGEKDYSIELCGGTHVTNTGEIGLLILQSESSIASGIRRITALTGQAALNKIQTDRNQYLNIASALKSNTDNVIDKVMKLIENTHLSEKKINKLQQQLIQHTCESLIKKAEKIKHIHLIYTVLEDTAPDLLRHLIDQLKQKSPNAIICLASKTTERTLLAVGISKQLTQQFNADVLLKNIASLLDGKGGGRADFSQGSAPACDTQKLYQILSTVKAWVTQHFN